MYQVCVSQGYGMMPEDIANNKKLIWQHWTPRGALEITHGAEAVLANLKSKYLNLRRILLLSAFFCVVSFRKDEILKGKV